MPQHENNHFGLSFNDRVALGDTYKEGGTASETIGASSPKQPEVTPYFHMPTGATISPNKLGLPADEQITEQLDEKSSLCSSQLKGSLKKQMPGLIACDATQDFLSRRRLSEELNECGADFCNYKSIDTKNLEKLLVQNMHDIRIVLTEYFRLRDFRKRSIER